MIWWCLKIYDENEQWNKWFSIPCAGDLLILAHVTPSISRQRDGWWILLHWRKMWWYMEENIDRGLFRFMHNEIPAVHVETLGNCQSELLAASWGATVTGRRKAVLWHCFTLQHTNNTSGILFQTERSNHMDWIHNQRNKNKSNLIRISNIKVLACYTLIL